MQWFDWQFHQSRSRFLKFGQEPLGTTLSNPWLNSLCIPIFLDINIHLDFLIVQITFTFFFFLVQTWLAGLPRVRELKRSLRVQNFFLFFFFMLSKLTSKKPAMPTWSWVHSTLNPRLTRHDVSNWKTVDHVMSSRYLNNTRLEEFGSN